MGEKRNAYRLLEGKPGGKRPLAIRRRWMDNIKMDLTEMGWGGVYSTVSTATSSQYLAVNCEPIV
jgi:hypothetical protein